MRDRDGPAASKRGTVSPAVGRVALQRSRSFKTRDRRSPNGSAAPKRGTVAVPRFQYAAPCVLAIFILCVLLNTVEVFGHCFALCNTVSYCAWGASAHWNRGIAHEQCQNSDKQYKKTVLNSATQYKFAVI